METIGIDVHKVATQVCRASRRMRPKLDWTVPGQRSVWGFPRQAIAERCAAHVRIEHGGHLIVDTRASASTVETSHSPRMKVRRSNIGCLLIARLSKVFHQLVVVTFDFKRTKLFGRNGVFEL